MIRKELGFEVNKNFEMQMFFDLNTNEILYKIFTGNKYI